MTSLSKSEARRSVLVTCAAFVIVCAGLRLGSDLLIPVALAVLTGFLLKPLVAIVERAGVPRVAAVVLVLIGIAGAAVGAALLATREGMELVANLPGFRANMAEKLQAAQGPLRSLVDALGWLERLSRELEPASNGRTPPEVSVVESQTALGTLSRLVTPLLGTLGVFAIVTVLAVFLLLEQRLMPRIGAYLALHDSRLSLRALDEAGLQVSRYLARQGLVCAIHGAAVWIGLTLIGVPGATLFASASAAFRLVPYLGPWIAAGLPITLCMAAFPGWSMTLYTSAFFVVLELVSNNVLEPKVFSRGTGLSAFGVVLGAVFWAWLWGPAGLFLAIPLTVCFAVVGRHIPELSLVPALFADEPVAEPVTLLRERLEAGDTNGATALLHRFAVEGDLVSLSDTLLLPLLAELRGARRSQVTTTLTQLSEAVERLRVELDLPRASSCGAVSAARGERLDVFASEWITFVLERCGFRPPDPRGNPPEDVHVSVDVGPQGIVPPAASVALCFGAPAQDPRSVSSVRELIDRLDLERADRPVSTPLLREATTLG